jgi:acid phosphatase
MSVPAYSHIVVVIMENHDYGEIIGNSSAPYINSLAAGGALLTNYTAITHPSQPNYFALYAGSTFGTSSDNLVSEPDPTIATILQSAGRTFAGYVESGATDVNHNPWESFPEGTTVERDFSLFPTTATSDFASLPTVSFVIPNLNDDMHNGTVAQGDTWLQNNLSAYAAWAKANNALLIVTWDEGDVSPNDQVATILYGADVVPGTYSAAYNHYNLLSTILAAYGLTGPNYAATAAPIGNGVFGATVCFAAGTRIRTKRGEVPIEQLKIGDKVVTQSGQEEPIVWIGTGNVLVMPGRRSAATSVIVRKNALGDNVPYGDLRLTKGHSLHLDGVLIPVEFLVNHRSIVWDDRARELAIYHIELPKHAVLLANGAPAESYRDDGNRWLYHNANTGWSLPPQEPCAPVLTGGPVVDGIWRQLLDRAGPRTEMPTTNDPDLHLLVDGRRIDAHYRVGSIYAFRLFAPPHSVRILSRAAVPGELGVARDPRLLGVALEKITLWQGPNLTLMEANDIALVEGFHAFETVNGLRWTNGNALLPEMLFAGFKGPIELELRVGCTTNYPLVGTSTQQHAA